MSENFVGYVPRVVRLRQRRAERLKREIALLSQMDERLWRKSLLCAALIIPALALVFAAAAAKLSYFSASFALIAPIALGLAVLCWWAGRYSLLLPWILFTLALAVIFESAPDIGDPGSDDRKTSRRMKIAWALDKRRALLAKLEAS
jgi:hypothetical protein